MARPFLLVQLSDPHVGATWATGDPVLAWHAAVEAVCGLPERPDAVLVTGDLADSAADDEYAVVTSALDRLSAPSFVLPGNHDDRSRLRAHFALGGTADAPVDYVADLAPVRLIVLDTTKPGEDYGELAAQQLAWLEAELSAAPEAPTLLAMHHPPFITGIPAWDAIGLASSDRSALAHLLADHPQVRRILAGHLHRTITAAFAGRIAFSAPSTYVQARLHFGATEFELSDEPNGFAVHAVYPGEVISHVHAITPRVVHDRTGPRGDRRGRRSPPP